MADLALLGIFEDVAQRDFHVGLVEACSEHLGLTVLTEPRLTDGCRFDFLQEHLELSSVFQGVLVAVDGKKKGLPGKVSALRKGLEKVGTAEVPGRVLWSVATPSIEEWMMADESALPGVLQRELGLRARPTFGRPGKTRAERTAKRRLRQWVYGLLGESLLRGGLEYAREVARSTAPGRVGAGRNPDLKELLDRRLPEFLLTCASRDGSLQEGSPT